MTYTVLERNTKGYVSGYVAPLYVQDDAEPLPTSIPIYMDERYGVAYITAGGTVYQYDGLVGRWVNIADGGHETFFNYRMPDELEEYLDGQLPDGFILSDGRVVGQVVNEREDLYYDVHAGYYWFVDDLVVFYYEPQLSAYIHVEDSSTYYRYPQTLAPPPSYDRDHIPSTMYGDLDMNVKFYSSGMTEIDVSDVKPRVQLDEQGYYIIIMGYRLDWSAENQLFVDKVGALPEEDRHNEDGSLMGVPADMVNLNGYSLDDPDAKPKVQEDEYGYYIIYQGNNYLWYSSLQAFLNGVPEKYLGKPITKDEVDLNGYTLP